MSPAEFLVSPGATPEGSEVRYSPAECKGTQKHAISGNPDPKRISTSYVERANLSRRMGLRRYTRLTNSKKLENHCAALAIYFMHYNFARLHITIRCSPAMAAGVTSHLWSVGDIVALLPVEAPKVRGIYKKRPTLGEKGEREGCRSPLSTGRPVRRLPVLSNELPEVREDPHLPEQER